MTASSLQVTPGSGLRLATNSYTEGAVTVHDEKVILGEQYLPEYTTAADSVSVATVNSHPLQIMAGASLRVRIHRIEIHQYTLATTAAFMELRLYRLTTAGTGGSASGANPLDPASAAAGATVMTLPTAKGTEGVVMAISKPYLMQTAAASAPMAQPILVWNFDGPRSQPLIIAAGTSNGIALKNMTAHAAATIGWTVWFTESSF